MLQHLISGPFEEPQLRGIVVVKLYPALFCLLITQRCMCQRAAARMTVRFILLPTGTTAHCLKHMVFRSLPH